MWHTKLLLFVFSAILSLHVSLCADGVFKLEATKGEEKIKGQDGYVNTEKYYFNQSASVEPVKLTLAKEDAVKEVKYGIGSLEEKPMGDKAKYDDSPSSHKLYYIQNKKELQIVMPKQVTGFIGKIIKISTVQGDDTKNSFTIEVQSSPYIEDVTNTRQLQSYEHTVKCIVRCLPLATSKPEEVFKQVKSSKKGSDDKSGATKTPSEERISYNMTSGDGEVTYSLYFKPLEFEDSGVWTCSAKNNLGSNTDAFEINVKDRLGALWPFIGIVVEVLILVTAILLYERRRSQAKKSKLLGNENGAGATPAADEAQQPLRNAGEEGVDDGLTQRTVNT